MIASAAKDDPTFRAALETAGRKDWTNATTLDLFLSAQHLGFSIPTATRRAGVDMASLFQAQRDDLVFAARWAAAAAHAQPWYQA